MTRIEFLEILTKRAKEFRKDTNGISRNAHLTGMENDPEQKVIDAVLVGFINHVGVQFGIDYALSVKDLIDIDTDTAITDMTKSELTDVFKYIVKKCDMIINNNKYVADDWTQDNVEDIAELCNHILDGDYGELIETEE